MNYQQSRLIFFFSCFFCVPFLVNAQDDSLTAFNTQRIQTSNKAMYVLGGWAIGNIALGAVQRSRLEGQQRYFHEMNLFWNLVNLGIAGAALYGNMKSDPAALGLYESLKEQKNLEKILWFNVALNTSYMVGGAWLKERAKNATNNPDRLRGYGNSLILQGAFLFVFDIGHVLIQQSQSSDKIQQLLSHVHFRGNGISLAFIF
ncbi:MAG: hypothetical protein AAF696_32390 [Bacteroidota bacterium]